MTKAELDSFEKSVEGMPGHMRSWILNRDVTKLVAEVRANGALIAELIAIAERAIEMQTDSADIERFAALKERAKK